MAEAEAEAETETETETKESPASLIRLQDLTDAERERVRLIEGLAREENRSRYLARQQKIAQQLGMTVRNVQRLVRTWERDGVSGLVR